MTTMTTPDRINATLARRLAAVRAEREAAHAGSYSAESFARWIASARRSNALRAALLDRLESATPTHHRQAA